MADLAQLEESIVGLSLLEAAELDEDQEKKLEREFSREYHLITRDDRLELGVKMGADDVVNAARENPVQRIRELTGGVGPDLVIVTAGTHDSLQQAIEMAPRGTDIVFLAHLDDPVTADIGLAVQKGSSIFTVRGEGRLSVSQALSLMAQGKITAGALITHTFPLDRIQEAIDTFAERRQGAIKVVVHP